MTKINPNSKVVNPNNQYANLTKPHRKSERGFFGTMERWSKPYFDGDQKLSIKEAIINEARGFGSIITETCSTPKKLAISLGSAAAIVGTAAGLVIRRVVSAPILLASASILSAGFAINKGLKAYQKFSTANGNEKKLAEAHFNVGETAADTVMATLAGGACKHALHAGKAAGQAKNIVREAKTVGEMFTDNGLFAGSQISKVS